MTSRDKIPDGIIRAYRKAIRAQEGLNDEHPTYRWIEGVKVELIMLYPDLNKLPKEE
jgi:hypothetical protein